MNVKDIKLFEELNPTISINVYGYNVKREKVTGPLYISLSKKENHVNLLLIKKHYCLITNLSGLLRKQITNHTSKMFICSICFKRFRLQTKFKAHVESKHEVNEYVVNKTFPQESHLEFNAYEKKNKKYESHRT